MGYRHHSGSAAFRFVWLIRKKEVNPVKVYMHHVKRLKDLNADNEFDELMLLKRRKSLALCPKCYEEAKTKSLKL